MAEDNTNTNTSTATDISTVVPQPVPVEDIFKKRKTAKQKCEEKGGVWDEATQTCKLPTSNKEDALKKEAEAKMQINRETSGFQIGDQKVTKEEYYRIKSILSGGALKSGSRGEIVTQEDRDFAKQFETTEAQRAIDEERERIKAEEQPQRRELDPTIGFGESIPVLGGGLGALKTNLDRWSNTLEHFTGIDLPRFKEMHPEELRTIALTEIERQEIERGLSDSEAFGALVEGIPIAGSLATKFAGGLIETPSGNAKEVKSNILKERRRITNIETNVKLGYLPVEVAQEQIGDIEQNVQRLESRLKLLINHSPELKYNSDLINSYETEILSTREKIFQAKQNILTGASKDPTEIEVLNKLQEYIEE